MKQRIRKKFFRYISYGISIKSNIALRKEQVKEIVNIVKTNTRPPYYTYAYHIARSIAYSLGRDSYIVEVNHTRFLFVVKIFYKYDE